METFSRSQEGDRILRGAIKLDGATKISRFDEMVSGFITGLVYVPGHSTMF